MKKRNQNGFLHVIAYFIIGLIFAVTVYACLDILDLIEVPEKYSVAKWLLDQKGNVIEEIVDQDVTQNIFHKVRVEIEEPNSVIENSSFDLSQLNGYEPTRFQENGQPKMVHMMYYQQLDSYAKIIYQELVKNLENMKSGTYNIQFGKTFDDLLHQENGEETLNQSFQLAINALSFDYPDLFYLDVSKIYLLTEITTKLWGTTYEVEIGASQGQSYLNPIFANQQQVKQAIQQIENEKQKIRSTLKGDTESQIKGVHDYLVENLEYDSTLAKDNIYNIYGALINKSTVCEGYARAFKYLMDDLGIPCLIACGTAINSSGQMENHAWNYVQLNENWYAIDVTWDDPVIIGNGYVSSSTKYKYYLKGAKEFFTNHTEDGNIVGDANFKYPTISNENY